MNEQTHLIPPQKNNNLSVVHTQGGNVPGGHWMLREGEKKPFISPTKEMDSIALRYDDVVVDIGAYVGTYAIRCARYPVKHVRAFEPTHRSFNVLKLNACHLPNIVCERQAVVGDDREEVNLLTNARLGVTNSLVGRKKNAVERVSAINYVDAVQDATVVKIDIEGGEYDFTPTDLVQPSMRAILIDFHPFGKDWIERSCEMISVIESHGFRCVIKPNWEHGWSRAGSWLREKDEEDSEEKSGLLLGRMCCACGHPIHPISSVPSICDVCAPQFLKRHLERYTTSTRLEED